MTSSKYLIWIILLAIVVTGFVVNAIDYEKKEVPKGYMVTVTLSDIQEDEPEVVIDLQDGHLIVPMEIHIRGHVERADSMSYPSYIYGVKIIERDRFYNTNTEVVRVTFSGYDTITVKVGFTNDGVVIVKANNQAIYRRNDYYGSPLSELNSIRVITYDSRVDISEPEPIQQSSPTNGIVAISPNDYDIYGLLVLIMFFLIFIGIALVLLMGGGRK